MFNVHTLGGGEMMMSHLHEDKIAAKIRTAYDAVLTDGKSLTRDLGGEANTEQFTDAILARLK